MTVYIVLKSFPDSPPCERFFLHGVHKSSTGAVAAIMQEHPHKDHPKQLSPHLHVIEGGFLFDNGKDVSTLYQIVEAKVQD